MLFTLLKQYGQTKWDQKNIHSRQTLKKIQNKRWQTFNKKVLQQSPFYQAYVNKPLSDFPIINKAIMNEEFNCINTLTLDKTHAFEVALKAEQSRDFTSVINGVSIGLSSGTSGQRGLFIVSPKERAFWAGSLLAKALPHSLFHKESIAFFLRSNNRLYETLSQSRTLSFHYFDLQESLQSQAQRLNQIKPSIVSAPATVLLELANAQQAGRIYITPHCIFSVAEVLEPAHQLIIEKTFNVRVKQIYQCTEGFLGISNQLDSTLIQLNEENLIIEKDWLDDHRFVPIITDLRRTSQPIVRYRLDDVLVIANDNISPFTQIKRIEGREGDVCYAVSDDCTQAIPVFSDTLRQTMASLSTPINDYQINQTALRNFSIAIEPMPEIKEKKQIEIHLNQLFKKLMTTPPHWHWQPFIATQRHNKNRRITCQLVDKGKSK